MATFITKMDGSGSGPRLAVKDLIDVEGIPTTAGSRAVADDAKPAEADAPCMAGARAADARIVGKVNLHELAFGTTGINPWFGTPTNPLDPALVPGGSSSGSAVAVATEEADVAYGSDTGGSVRIPSACCGTAGLKTTHGRISIEGVWPLAPSMDTIGPMARDVAGLVLGMELLEPGFAVSDETPTTVGRVRVDADSAITDAIEAALRAAELDVQPVDMSLETGRNAGFFLLPPETWGTVHHLLERDGVSDELRAKIGLGEHVTAEQVTQGSDMRRAWEADLSETFRRFEVLALPVLPAFPPRVDGEIDEIAMSSLCIPFNVAGTPALALPVPTSGPLPASIQLVGPRGSEERLLALGRIVEQAVRSLAPA